MVPIELETAPATPVFFVVGFFDENGTGVLSAQSVQQPAGTQSYTFTVNPPSTAAHYIGVWAYTYTSGVAQQWGYRFLPDSPYFHEAEPVVSTPGVVTTLDTVILPEGAEVKGTVAVDPTTGILSSAAEVEIYRIDEADQPRFVTRTRAESDGFFQAYFIPAGTYVARVESVDKRLAPVYTDPFTVVAGPDVMISAAVDEFRSYSSDRLAGDSRFTTAVEITQELFPGAGPVGIPVLYIANGLNYPDALSAGPVAAKGGGALLIVTPTSIPAPILAEIERLAPERIVVVGGPTNVSAALFSQLGGLAPDVDRIAGSDRFDTSRRLIADAFGCPGASCSAPAVFVATGLNYPDALAAGAAAGGLGAPVLLVNGSASAIDDSSADLIADLQPERLFLLGGESSVSAGIAGDLAGSALWITRLAGVDRFETGALIARVVVKRSDTVYGATGLNFADALVGGPLAAAHGAPILLTPTACTPVPVNDAVIAVDASRIVYLGSSLSIQDVLRPDDVVIC